MKKKKRCPVFKRIKGNGDFLVINCWRESESDCIKEKMSEKQSLRVQMTEAILTKNVDSLTLDIFDAMNTKYGDRFFDEDFCDEDDDGSDDECMVCDEF